MTIQSYRELEVTRMKLRGLEEQYNREKHVRAENTYVQQLTLRSLKKWINRLTEEIARFEAHAKTSK